jgi:hypothetical protein
VHAFAVVEHFAAVSHGEAGACFHGKGLPLIHLVLQRGDEPPGDGDVPTHACPAHRHAHSIVSAVVGVRGGGVLRSSVVVKDRSWLQMPVQPRHLQCVDDQGRARVVGDLPAHHHARGQVDDGRQKQPPLRGAQVGDVSDQAGAGGDGGEVPIQQITGLVVAFPVGGRYPIRPRLHGLQREFAHHISDQTDRASMPACVQYARDAPAPIGFLELFENLAHLDGELSPASRRVGDRFAGRSVQRTLFSSRTSI